MVDPDIEPTSSPKRITPTRRGVLVFVALMTGPLSGIAWSASLDETLMEATVKIRGHPHPTDTTWSIGTGFFVVQRAVDKKGDTCWITLLVTARHVLDSIGSDTAYVQMRRPLPGGGYRKSLESIVIRRSGVPVWTQHPNSAVDVAIWGGDLYDTEPPMCVPTFCFATDAEMKYWCIGPGVEARCLGYPLGAEGEEAGFPILRGGLIASYPILPSREHPVIQYDFEVYPGNSGGPVYFVKEVPKDSLNQIYILPPVQRILGLVTVQYFSPPGSVPKTEIKLGGYVPAVFIQETIDKYLKENGYRGIPGPW